MCVKFIWCLCWLICTSAFIFVVSICFGTVHRVYAEARLLHRLRPEGLLRLGQMLSSFRGLGPGRGLAAWLGTSED